MDEGIDIITPHIVRNGTVACPCVAARFKTDEFKKIFLVYIIDDSGGNKNLKRRFMGEMNP
jgi:hypothetical protein